MHWIALFCSPVDELRRVARSGRHMAKRIPQSELVKPLLADGLRPGHAAPQDSENVPVFDFAVMEHPEAVPAPLLEVDELAVPLLDFTADGLATPCLDVTMTSSARRCDATTPALPPEKEAHARHAFETFNNDGSGQINFNEFAALLVKDQKVAELMGLRRAGHRSRYRRSGARRRSNVDAVFKDVCGSGKKASWPMLKRYIAKHTADTVACEVDDFLSPQPCLSANEAETAASRLIFNAIDTDCSGTITCAELAAACVKRPAVAAFVAGGSSTGKARRLGADALFRQMDPGGHKCITFQEFTRFIASRHET